MCRETMPPTGHPGDKAPRQVAQEIIALVEKGSVLEEKALTGAGAPEFHHEHRLTDELRRLLRERGYLCAAGEMVGGTGVD